MKMSQAGRQAIFYLREQAELGQPGNIFVKDIFTA
jgi:hypothetical protein